MSNVQASLIASGQKLKSNIEEQNPKPETRNPKQMYSFTLFFASLRETEAQCRLTNRTTSRRVNATTMVV